LIPGIAMYVNDIFSLHNLQHTAALRYKGLHRLDINLLTAICIDK